MLSNTCIRVAQHIVIADWGPRYQCKRRALVARAVLSAPQNVFCLYFAAELCILSRERRSGEMADTRDLKSLAKFLACGFESRLRHNLSNR